MTSLVKRKDIPVGRLDAADSEGLIIVNDGELAHRLTHPSFRCFERVFSGSRRGGAIAFLS